MPAGSLRASAVECFSPRPLYDKLVTSCFFDTIFQDTDLHRSTRVLILDKKLAVAATLDSRSGDKRARIYTMLMEQAARLSPLRESRVGAEASLRHRLRRSNGIQSGIRVSQ